MRKALTMYRKAPYKLFFKRNIAGKVDGLLTLKADDGRIIFQRMLARTGQNGGYTTSWINGSSGTPVGEWRVWIKPKSPYIEQINQDAGARGIGEFFRISSGDDFMYTINPANFTQKRHALGLHQDNIFKGSLGCCAVAVETEEQKAEWKGLTSFLKELGKKYDYLPIEVFF